MNQSSKLRCALASCRRVFVGVTLLLVVVAGVLWWQLPGINSLKPEVELWLKESLHLEQVAINEIAWSWHDHFAVKASDISFLHRSDQQVEQQSFVQAEHINLYINLSLWELITGNILPSRVAFEGGLIKVKMSLSGQEGTQPRKDMASNDLFAALAEQLPGQLMLEKVDIDWQVQTASELFQARWPATSLTIIAKSKQARFSNQSVEISLNWQHKITLDAQIYHIDWMPESYKDYLSGPVRADVQLQQLDERRWSFAISSQAEQGMLAIPSARFELPFDQMDMSGLLSLADDHTLTSLKLEQVRWQHQSSQVEGDINWQQGRLDILGTTQSLAMPQLWLWLQGLDDDPDWHEWLRSMRAGTATQAEARVSMPWKNLQAMPTQQELDALTYAVQGHVEGADIRLGLSPDYMTGMQADVDLDENQLTAKVTQASVPHQVGKVQGVLNIPWSTLILDIYAHGHVRADYLQQWLDTESAKELQWVEAVADASTHIVWDPAKDMPDEVSILLRPQQWKLEPNQVALEIDQGEVEWNLQTGIHAKALQVKTPLSSGVVEFNTLPRPYTDQLQSFSGQLTADFHNVVQHFKLPVEQSSGKMQLDLSYKDERWSGQVVLKEAGWSNLMGNKKDPGQPLNIRFDGQYERTGHLKLDRMSCDDHLFKLRGSGLFGDDGMRLTLSQLKTKAFDGSLKIKGPFGDKPWEVDVDATYLSRDALPKQLEENKQLKEVQKSWVLRADINTFQWADARMKNVHINLASATESTGVFRAGTIKLGSLNFHDVKALFALPGKGMVDLRELKAGLEEQQLFLSATMFPDADGGMQWQGFAKISGTFGSLMKRAELSQLFDGGKMTALFSGQGKLLKDGDWWDDLNGRLRLRVDDGVIQKGGTLTKFLAAISLADLPKLLIGDRKDLTSDGLLFKRMQIEAFLQGKIFDIKNLVFRSSALDVAGQGKMDLISTNIDMIMVARPFQNLDAMLSKIPLLRDILGGAAHSFMRKIYRMHGPVANAEVDSISAKEAGLAGGGLVENLLDLPSLWFDPSAQKKKLTVQ